MLTIHIRKDLKNHLLFLNRLEDLDYASLIAINIYAFKNLAVFSPSNFPNNLIVILITGRKRREENERKISSTYRF